MKSTEVHPMVRAYRRSMKLKLPVIRKSPEEIQKLETLRWERVKADNEPLLSPLT